MANTTTQNTSAANATQAETNPTQQPLAGVTQAKSTPIEGRDLEKNNPGPQGSSQDGQEGPADTPPKDSDEPDPDPDLVTWDGPNDPEHPKNWPDRLKWRCTWAVSLFVLISPVSSAMVAPAIQDLAAGLDMHAQVEAYLSLAIFVLAYAVGPVLFGPASELYGRRRLLQASNLWYLVWNLGCGFARTKGQFFAFRFLAGVGGSAPLALGGGAIR